MKKVESLLEVRNKFRRLVEYIETEGTISEDETDPMAGGETMAGGDPNAMSGDPSMGGGADPMAGGDPNAMGGDPSMSGDPNAMPPMGGDPSMGDGAEGFQPQGPDATMGVGDTQNLGGDPNAMGGDQGEDEVIDVDDLTKSQEETEKKVDRILDKFERMDDKYFGTLDKVVDMINKSNERMDSIELKIDSKMPDPEQKMSLRAQKSAPFTDSVEKYWQTEAPENYSPEDDNNGIAMPEYSITKQDIDDATNMADICKSFDDEDEKYGHMTLRDIYNL